MSNTLQEVRYERLRPAQVVKAREACPVAYLPIGTIEWHGEHNPVGLDTLKIHALLIKCAQKTGGLVFPPLYYGENREQALMEANSIDRNLIAEKMSLPASNFDPGYMVETVSEQNRNYHNLLVHIFHQIKSLGFKVLVVGAGHYPLIDHGRSAAAFFHQEQSKPKMLTWVMSGYELVKDMFKPCGDHAGKWETSLLMYLDPGMQDLSVLPQDRNIKPVGVSNNGAQDSSAEFGRQTAGAIVEAVKAKVEYLLNNYDLYKSSHGCPV